jgi:hypothetical protein
LAVPTLPNYESIRIWIPDSLLDVVKPGEP